MKNTNFTITYTESQTHRSPHHQQPICPSISSANTQPIDQMSIVVVNSIATIYLVRLLLVKLKGHTEQGKVNRQN